MILCLIDLAQGPKWFKAQQLKVHFWNSVVHRCVRQVTIGRLWVYPREHIGNCKGFLTAYVSSSTLFLPNMQFECCMILQGTLGGSFDIFAASGESTAWVLLWKTRSRPLGVRVCPVAQFNFFKTAFDPRAWTLVVFWKEVLERQPQLITPENEGGDNTYYPSPPNVSYLL